MAGVAGDFPQGERGDLFIDTHKTLLSRFDSVIGRGGVRQRAVAEKAKEIRFRKKVSDVAFRMQDRPSLHDVTEFTPTEFAHFKMDVPLHVFFPIVAPKTDTAPIVAVSITPYHFGIFRVRGPVAGKVAGLTAERAVFADRPPFGHPATS